MAKKGKGSVSRKSKGRMSKKSKGRVSRKSKKTKVDKSMPLDEAAMTNLYYISHNVMDAMFFRGIAHPSIKKGKGKKGKKGKK